MFYISQIYPSTKIILLQPKNQHFFYPSDENSRNEFAHQINSVSRSNPIKSSMLRPSALQSGLAAAATSTSAAPKVSLLRPAAFQVGSTTEEASTTSAASSTASSSAVAANPFLSVLNTSTDDTENEAKPKHSENGSENRTDEVCG